MTPEQVREMYRATNARIRELAAEEEALEDMEQALDSYVKTRGWILSEIVDSVIEQPEPEETDDGEVPSAPPADGRPPAPVSKKPRKETHLCPRCSRPFGSAHAVQVHVGRAHADPDAPAPSAGRRQSTPPPPVPRQEPRPTASDGRIPGLGE